MLPMALRPGCTEACVVLRCRFGKFIILRGEMPVVARRAIEERDFLASGCGRPNNSVDYVMLFNILHVENPVALLCEACRVLRPNGLAGIIHWNHDLSTPRGPSLDIRQTPEQCRNWALTAGFHFIRNEPFSCCPWHYGLVVHKPAQF